ncbi:MAG: response regulator transcription factor [Lachnospiraceae bacterium]|nr:response regulator transcription factor [Lachnospiraceae bacterium]
MIQVLLVEDDEFIAKVLIYYLKNRGNYQVNYAKTSGEALGRARDAYDIILLDVLLPDADGVSLCRQLRQWQDCPIIFFSCLDDSDTIIRALDAGGDDFLVKPFDNDVLLARIEANLRRSRRDFRDVPKEEVTAGGFRLNVSDNRLYKDGREIALPPMECRLLAFLMQNRGKYFSSEELYRRVWGKESLGDVRTVLVHIRHLRMKLEEDPGNARYLKSIWGKGYTFEAGGCHSGRDTENVDPLPGTLDT